ncbi:MAG: dihydrolipoamide acetyltransferase family protein [Saccharospirillum sp.]
MSDFRMPSLGADMDSATLVKWLVKPGDAVKRGDVIAVVETAKGAIEVEIFETGEIESLLVDVDSEVEVGATLARIRSADAPTGPRGASAETQTPAASPAVPSAVADETEGDAVHDIAEPAVSETATDGSRILASPLARVRAKALQTDLAGVSGTGPGGAILARDLPSGKPAQGAPAAKARSGFDPQAMRQAIASAMSRSKREIPHYYLQTRIDMANAMAWLADYNRQQEPANRLILSALMLRATAMALQAFPEFNGYWEDNALRPSDAIHLGMAINLRSLGLITPALRNLEQASLNGVMRQLQDVTFRARQGGLRSSEIGTATITVTALGDRGVDAVFGVIFPPQVAILGFGRLRSEPVAVGDALTVHPVMQASLSADHRASDGHRGALFLDRIAQLLAQPASLAEPPTDQGAPHDN